MGGITWGGTGRDIALTLTAGAGGAGAIPATVAGLTFRAGTITSKPPVVFFSYDTPCAVSQERKADSVVVPGSTSVIDPSCAESAPTDVSGTKIHATDLCPAFEAPGGLRFTPTESAVTRPSEMKVRSLATQYPAYTWRSPGVRALRPAW